jgi:hypothetical protein
MLFEDAYIQKTSKPRDYFPIYNEIFNNIDRLDKYNILEIGIDTGCGLNALKNYFPNSIIYGLDIISSCKQHENIENDIHVLIGSQVDDHILNILFDVKFDLIIDDGSHNNEHVFYTFHKLFPSLNHSKIGLYIVEDTHTSYWPYYNGGYKKNNSTIELFKNIIDFQHAWCIRDKIDCHIPPYSGFNFSNSYYESWVKYIQFYENIIVIKKRQFEARCSKPI